MNFHIFIFRVKCLSIFHLKSLQRKFVKSECKLSTGFHFHQNKAYAEHLIRLYVLTGRFKANEKNSNGIKGLVILQKSEYSCDFVNKTLLVCCFARYYFSCSVDTPRLNITFRAVFWAQFFGPCSLFPLEFYFLISSHLLHLRKFENRVKQTFRDTLSLV